MKIKRKRTLNTSSEDSHVEKSDVAQQARQACTEFLAECRKRELAGKGLHAYLCERYNDCFKTDPPSDKSSSLVKIKVAYYLLVIEGYHKYNINVPVKVSQNYEASQGFHIDKFHPDMGCLLSISERSKSNEKEVSDMAKKTKVKKVVKETKGPKVQELWIQLFSSSHSKNLTDDQLAKEMTKLAAGKTRKGSYTAADIARHRSLYNLGKIAGQTGKPKSQIEKYEPKKK